jgi:hypothetical protein
MLSDVCPYLETRQLHEGDEGNAERHAEEVHKCPVRYALTLRLGSLAKTINSPKPRKSRIVLTLRLGSLMKAMKATQSAMPRKSISAQ